MYGYIGNMSKHGSCLDSGKRWEKNVRFSGVFKTEPFRSAPRTTPNMDTPISCNIDMPV